MTKIYESQNLIPNTHVGLLSGMAMGSVITQQTLNTFHSAGTNDGLVSQGIARTQEILNNSSSLPRTVIKISSDRETSKLVYTCIKDLTNDPPRESSIQYCPWINIWIDKFGDIFIPQEPHVLISIKLDYRKQLEHNFVIESFGQVDWGDSSCVNTPIPIACSPLIKNGDECFNELLVAFRYDIYILQELGTGIFADNVSIDSRITFFVEKVWIPKILNQKLFGIEGVEKVFVNGDEEGCVIICEPSASIINFIKLDPVNIICNKTSEMVRVFGIEVGRQCLIVELSSIIQGIYKCHIEVLVDYMVWSGKINSISRYSVRQDPDTLKRMSFEEAIRNVITACISGELDPLISISSQITASKRVAPILQ